MGAAAGGAGAGGQRLPLGGPMGALLRCRQPPPGGGATAQPLAAQSPPQTGEIPIVTTTTLILITITLSLLLLNRNFKQVRNQQHNYSDVDNITNTLLRSNTMMILVTIIA